MALGLNSLNDESLTAIDVDKNIDLTANEDLKKDIVSTETTNLDKTTDEPNKKSIREKILEEEKRILKHEVKRILKSSKVKKKIDKVVSSYSKAIEDKVQYYKYCTEAYVYGAESQITEASNELVNNVGDFKNHIPTPEKFLDKVTDKIVKHATLDTKHKLNKDAKRLDNCNNTNTKLSGELSNMLGSTIAAQMIENADCIDNSSIDVMGCTANGLFSAIGVSSTMISSIIRKVSNNINMTAMSLDKITQNERLKKIAKTTFKHKKTITRIFKNKEKEYSYSSVGEKTVDVFGNESIKTISDLTKKSKSKSKNKDFFLASALKKVIATA